MQIAPWELSVRSSSPLPSFIVALFLAAAIFNRLVLHSHRCVQAVQKAKRDWGKNKHRSEYFIENFHRKACISPVIKAPL